MWIHFTCETSNCKSLKLCTTLNSAIYLIDSSRYLLRYIFLNSAANSRGQLLVLCLSSDSSYACILTSLPSACRYIIAICYLLLCLCMQIPCHFSMVSNLCSVQACFLLFNPYSLHPFHLVFISVYLIL